MIAVRYNYLGKPWVDRYARRPKKSFLTCNYVGKGRPIPGQTRLARDRVIRLSEMLFNLQNVSFIEDPIKLLAEGQIETTYASLEIAKVLQTAGVEFRFNVPIGKRGSDYDIVATLPDGRLMPVETKCRLASETTTKRSILNRLQNTTNQLPAGGIGAIVVRVPDSWGTGSFIETTFAKEARQVLRNTTRISSIVVAAHITVAGYGDQAPGFLWRREILNPAVSDREQKIIRLLPDGPPIANPKNWTFLTEEFGLARSYSKELDSVVKKFANVPPNDPF